MNLPIHISRKDIASILGENISARWVQRHEKRLGLDKVRVKCVRQPILYRTRPAVLLLAKQGFDISGVRFLPVEDV